jgi:ATP-dependent DNA helicase RecG
VDVGLLESLVREVRAVGSDTSSIEVKAAARKLPRTVTETLSAFCNGSGGTLILGLDEASGFHPVPGFDPVRIREALARASADDIVPPVRSAIEIVPFEGAYVVVAHIPEIDPLANLATSKIAASTRGHSSGAGTATGN